MATLEQIDHVVVLMLENRSFDSMLGRLYAKSPQFEGLSGDERNLDRDGAPVPVWNCGSTAPQFMNLPDPDPGESWCDINMQLFEDEHPPAGAVPTMGGFVRNYQAQDWAGDTRAARTVMHHYRPEQVPVISTLARQFAVCDCWHASAPCQTWPNRFFAHTGTAGGYENNAPPRFPYRMPTIFNRFDRAGMDDGWKIYFHDLPHTLTLAALWQRLDRFRFFDEFRSDAKAGTLPRYAFIEPRYFTDTRLPNDQHPPHIVTLGEQLVADVYNCLRGGPAWTRTLLVVTYDEHGGCYDHVPPPKAQPPAATASDPFNFDRYGVRVPAVIASPWIVPGTVLRPPDGAPPFDHTSIIATLRRRFELGAPLGSRDAAAPDLEPVLELAAPANLGPEQLEALPYVTTPALLAAAKAIPINGMQRALLQMTRCLPAQAGEAASHIQALQAAAAACQDAIEHVVGDTAQEVTHAIAQARSRLDALFGSQP